MISLPIRDKNGEEVGTYEFDPDELAPGINKQLLHDAVVMYQSNKRVGTVRTKSRGMVSGSTKKLYRQKGTGRARAGMRRSPIRRGGGHTFAKTNKDWSYRLPRKALRKATRMALLSKFLDDEAVVLDHLEVEAPKTKEVTGILKSLGLDKDSCLIAIADHDSVVWKSSRNIANLQISTADDLNAYDLLHQKRLLVTTAALDRLRGIGGGDDAESTPQDD